MPYAARIHEFGGPNVFRWESIDVGDPGAGKVRVRHTAIGLNFVDVYNRRGRYPMRLPAILGNEAAGIIEAVGAGVTEFQIGDRIAYAPFTGSYCEQRLISADKLIRLPANIDDRTAAGMMLAGMTAQYLLRQLSPVQPGDTVLVQAAAGSVGLILCQWAAALGARVIGTVSSAGKAQLALSHGCHDVINYCEEDVAHAVARITEGKGVSVVYDGVGSDTFRGSLKSLKPLGHLIIFGQASGPVPPFDVHELAALGSLSITVASLQTFIEDLPLMRTMAHELFDMVSSGQVKIHIGQTYPLSEVGRAHQDLEARHTQGSTLLLL
ncbi:MULTISPECIES: quinone oxidoreductase family protein [Pseudomonas]|uniref:quinone oxidoreductase family protein n=1 Tax=Pseudomonas TaxID=286 RepID=UPI00069F79D2|nr:MULTISPECIES: quinone oxidoreductase [Pseudomonas]